MITYRYGHIDKLPESLTLCFAGTCASGIAAWAWQVIDKVTVLKSDRGIIEAKRTDPTQTLAEWTAVGYGLRWLQEEKWANGMLTINGSSIAVFNGFTGRDEAKGFTAALNRCKEIVAQLGCKRFSTLATAIENEPTEILARMAHREASK